MTDFVSKFNGRRVEHRAQMLQILIALSREVINGPNGMKFKQNFFANAKNLGWISAKTRTKKQGLVQLVQLAKEGFGYVPKGSVLQALNIAQKKTKKVA
jgi:hypothetical protein